jgi:hypothetical protein
MATQNSSNIKDAGIVYSDGAGVFAGNNLSAVTNTIASTDTNGDVILSPNGTGGVVAVTSLTVGNASKDIDFTINGASIGASVSVEGTDTTDLGGVLSHRHSATAGFGGHFIGLRSRGTHASPTVVSADDTIGLLAFAGFDGTDYAQAAQVLISVDGTPGSDDMPGRMTFLTSADGGQTPTEAMRIDSSQRVGIGTTTPLDTFHVVGAMELDHTAIENDDHALELVCDAAGYGDVKALDIDYVTGAVGATQDEEVILVNIDETLSTGGEVSALQVLATTEGSVQAIALKCGPNIDAIRQEVGTFGNMDSALNKAVDVLAALSSGGAGNISAFVADNDTFTVGDAASFGALEIVLDTGASGGGISPTWEYSTGIGLWSSFSPADGTNGLRNTGVVEWDVTDLAGFAVGTGSEFLIRITRTKNSLSTTPIIDLLQISALTEYNWDKNAALSVASLTLATDLAVTEGGNARSTATAYAVICGGTTATGAHQSIASVGSSGQVLTSTGAGSLPTFQAAAAASEMQPGSYFNFGITISAGTITVQGESATLSGSNKAKFGVQSNVTQGLVVSAECTADYSFDDDAGTSDIINNLFGATTGIAWGNATPFYGYLALDSSDANPEVFLSRHPALDVIPTVAEIGDPGDAVADESYSVWSINTITEASYAGSNCIRFFSLTGTMSTSDDWTFAALTSSTGIGKFQENVWFAYPKNQNGAASGTHYLDNGGTAIQGSTETYDYKVASDGTCHISSAYEGVTASGAVSVLLALPYSISTTTPRERLSASNAYYYDSTTNANGIMIPVRGAGANTVDFFRPYVRSNLLNSIFASADGMRLGFVIYIAKEGD